MVGFQPTAYFLPRGSLTQGWCNLLGGLGAKMHSWAPCSPLCYTPFPTSWMCLAPNKGWIHQIFFELGERQGHKKLIGNQLHAVGMAFLLIPHLQPESPTAYLYAGALHVATQCFLHWKGTVPHLWLISFSIGKGVCLILTLVGTQPVTPHHHHHALPPRE